MDFLEILTSSRKHRYMEILKNYPLTPSDSEFVAFLKNYKLMMIGEDRQIQQFLRWLLLKITSGLKNSPGYLFWLEKLKNDIKIALKPLVLSYRKISSKCTMWYISVKKNDVTLSKPFFNDTFLNTINLIWWKKEFFLGSLTIFNWSQAIFQN